MSEAENTIHLLYHAFGVENKFLPMSSLSIRLKGKASTYRQNPIKHDFRLYAPDEMPDYIRPERTRYNLLLFCSKPPPSSREEVKQWKKAVEEENKEIFRRLKEEGVVPKNQGYKIANPVIPGILTLSHEAQRKLREDNTLFNKFLECATEYLQLLAKALGTDLLYAVVHLDETAPHIHFALRNLSYKDPDPDAVKKLGWEDLLPKLKKIKGKAISRIFHTKVWKPRDYQIPIERLQDSLEFFRPRIGFGRGIPKKVRLERGEPYWKVIYRSVKQLHEDLPKEIELKKQELLSLEQELELKREELLKLKNQLLVLREAERLMQDTVLKKAKELEELETKARNTKKEYEELSKQLNELSEEINRLKREREDLRQKINNLVEQRDLAIKQVKWWEDQKAKVQATLKELEEKVLRLEQKRKEEERKVSELREEVRKLQELAKKIEEDKVWLLRELKEAVEENERLKEENERLKLEVSKLKKQIDWLETENEELKRQLYGNDFGLGR